MNPGKFAAMQRKHLSASPTPSAESLGQAIRDEHWQVRKFALKALQSHVSETVLPTLIPLLCDDYSCVRKEAALRWGPLTGRVECVTAIFE